MIRALAAGVPLVCMPMGRDQNENAARVVYHGAGVRVSPRASAERVRAAIRAVIDSPRYRQRAGALGAQIVEDARQSLTVPILEEIAVRTPASALAVFHFPVVAQPFRAAAFARLKPCATAVRHGCDGM